MSYHEGELAVQKRAGVTGLAAKVGRIIDGEIAAFAAAFLARQRYVILSVRSDDGAPSARIVGGEPGFAEAVDPHTVTLTPAFGRVDDVRGDVGMLAIELATRRRIRINGTASANGNMLTIITRQVYANCPQYIHPRSIEPRPAVAAPTSIASPVLDESQCDWIERADTFFIATNHPTAGADASHRGGPSGFVTVVSPTRLTFPDFSGNNMFNTLGNLAVNPRCALLFVDFDRGATLEVRGAAVVEWEGEERQIVIDILEAIETTNAVPLQ